MRYLHIAKCSYNLKWSKFIFSITYIIIWCRLVTMWMCKNIFLVVVFFPFNLFHLPDMSFNVCHLNDSPSNVFYPSDMVCAIYLKIVYLLSAQCIPFNSLTDKCILLITVYDTGPTLKQHWLNGSCLLGCHLK